MARLQLESATDTLDLDSYLRAGRGVQVRSGVTGLGLPPKQVQWLEGAGDGALPRGRRVLPRDMDLPLMVHANDREDLKKWLSRLAMILAGTAILRLIEDDGTSWYTEVEHVGGGQYVYGQDTVGENDFFTVITLRSGDPFFTYSVPKVVTVKADESGPGLLGVGLANLSIANWQAMGTITLDNTGDVRAYPVWEIHGPGHDFRAISTTGAKLHWTGSLEVGESLTIDTRNGSVVDHLGENRYAELAPAPRFWPVPPGSSTSVCSFDGISTGQSFIRCTWRPRKWMVV